MKYLKLFEEMNIDRIEFPEQGHDLSTREMKILNDLVGKKYLKKFFNIKVDDHYYYTINSSYYNVFGNFNELKDYVLSIYYMSYNKEKKYLKLLNMSELDPSFDRNRPIRWASEKGKTEIVKHLLNDPRVDPSDQWNLSICLASRNRHSEVVRLLLNDKRVISKSTKSKIIKYTSGSNLTEEEINKYINEIS